MAEDKLINNLDMPLRRRDSLLRSTPFVVPLGSYNGLDALLQLGRRLCALHTL